MQLFDIFSPESSFMCCKGPLGRGPQGKKGWKHLFMECHQCHRGKTLCQLSVGLPPPIPIWLCVPCERNRPSISQIILAAAEEEAERWRTNPSSIPIVSMPFTFERKPE